MSKRSGEEKTMTRMGLADILYENHGFNRTESKQLIDCFFEEVSLALLESKSVKISGFGSFHIRDKRGRMGRNPKTGEEYQIKPRSVVRFRSSHKLREKINIKTLKNQNDASNEPFTFSA